MLRCRSWLGRTLLDFDARNGPGPWFWHNGLILDCSDSWPRHGVFFSVSWPRFWLFYFDGAQFLVKLFVSLRRFYFGDEAVAGLWFRWFYFGDKAIQKVSKLLLISRHQASWSRHQCKQGVLFGVDFYLFLHLIVAASKPIGELIRATQRSILIVLGQIEAPRIHKITSSWPDDDALAVSANLRQNICTKHLVTQRCYSASLP